VWCSRGYDRACTGTSFHNIDGVTGRVVPPKDEKALADAIAEICEHEYKYDPQ